MKAIVARTIAERKLKNRPNLSEIMDDIYKRIETKANQSKFILCYSISFDSSNVRHKDYICANVVKYLQMDGYCISNNDKEEVLYISW